KQVLRMSDFRTGSGQGPRASRRADAALLSFACRGAGLGLYSGAKQLQWRPWEEAMQGLMSERPLLVSEIIKHAAIYHRDTEIVSRTVEGPIHRYTYAEAERRSKRLARALLKLGIRPGDRVGTLAWNTFRHFELYYAISGIGAVCHTINPRLFDEQIVYIINHAEERLLFADTSFAPLIERLAPHLSPECRIIWMTEEGAEPATGLSLPGLP